MAEPTSPSAPVSHQDGSATRSTFRKAPVDFLSGIIASSIIPAKSNSPTTSVPPNPQLTTFEKAALSVQTTTLNFKNFVSKSGPVFAAQNAVESIFAWKDSVKTLACACIWAGLSLYPMFFILLPNLALIWILLSTHSQRHPHGIGSDLEVDAVDGTHVTDEPIEGSVDYLANMQNIQNLMGQISEASDFVREHVVCYLDWSHPQLSMAILHLAVLSSIILALLGPFIPWRYVLLTVGEMAFVCSHPWVRAWTNQLQTLAEETALDRRLKSALMKVIANDALSDQVIESPQIITLSCLEHERYAAGEWSQAHLDPHDPSAWVQEGHDYHRKPVAGLRHVSLPESFSWIPGETWSIEHTFTQTPELDTDPDGWVFLNRASLGPSIRRRRWLRRAYETKSS